jgi:hypothetical protein
MYYYKQIKKQSSTGTLDRYISCRNNNACISYANKTIRITSIIITYGSAASVKIAKAIAKNIQNHWNRPKAKVLIDGVNHTVEFKIKGVFHPNLPQQLVVNNKDQKYLFIRVEDEVSLGVSLMDGVCSNTGFFKVTNVAYKGASTEAHEYGHALGLVPNTPDGHPQDLDLRGKGSASIMYPRGTWVDPKYQYDPSVPAGQKGGTIMPDTRKVKQIDIDMLELQARNWKQKGTCRVGKLSSKWHPKEWKA